MKNQHIVLLFIAIILSACTPTISKLIGTYQTGPFQAISNKNLDVVWSNTIDLFAQKGISIKIIDKSSGLILTEKVSFLKNYTIEQNGKSTNPSAWIVLNQIYWGTGDVKPQVLTGEWNIRLKPSESGGTIINVNITNLIATAHFDRTQYTLERTFDFDARSTGVFESMVADNIK